MEPVGMPQTLKAEANQLKLRKRQTAPLQLVEQVALVTKLKFYEKKLYYWFTCSCPVAHYGMGAGLFDWLYGQELVAVAPSMPS